MAKARCTLATTSLVCASVPENTDERMKGSGPVGQSLEQVPEAYVSKIKRRDISSNNFINIVPIIESGDKSAL